MAEEYKIKDVDLSNIDEEHICCAIGNDKTNKQRAFMVDKKFFVKQGFETVDSAPPFFELVVKKFDGADGPAPKFTKKAKKGVLPGNKGLTFFYSHLCPFNEDFTHIMADVGRGKGLSVKIVKIKSLKEAKELPVAWGIFNAFLDEELISHEIATVKRFGQILDKKLAERK